MKNRLITLLQFALFWLLFFITGKTLFTIFNISNVDNFLFLDFLASLLYGLKLDISFLGYISVLPFLLFIIDSFFPKQLWRNILNYYSYTLIILFSLFTITDAVLYQHWGIKLDAEPLKYINRPSLIIGNLSFTSLLFQIIIFLTLVSTSIIIFNKCVKFKPVPNKGNLPSGIIMIILGINLLWPIRGGFDIKPKIQLGIPIQISTVFFHSNIFYNHIAYNVPWYIGQSLVHYGKKSTSLNIVDSEMAVKKFKNLQLLNNKTDSTKLLKVKQPNIVLIVLESFTANVIEPLGGKKGVSPNLTKLAKEGILFTNCYATGTHSDKGLGAIYSGSPALPKTSVVEVPNKMSYLDYFTQSLKEDGYSTQMNYGGDLNFGNFSLLFSEAGIEKTIGKNDFPNEQLISKWGIPDEFTMQFLFEQTQKAKQPFYQSLFTLSSHAPFDTPMEPVFKIYNEDDKFYNSVYYTDRELGKFISKLKQTSVWDSTLIILIADHGVNYGSKKPRHDPSKFKIPMLWLGGALSSQGIQITQTCSQTDIYETLLNQLNIDHSKNPYSKDILKSKGYAFYSYNNGFGFVTDSSTTCYDLNAKQFIINTSKNDSLSGTYYMQYWADNFNKLGKIN